jgi:hypothetical protein
VILSRLLTVFPILYASGEGVRGSLLPSINLAQMSEFSLVIVALGAALGHVSSGTVGVLTFVFAITSVTSTYMITYNHELQAALGRGLARLGLRDSAKAAPAGSTEHGRAGVALLGFYRDASSILHQFEMEETQGAPHPVLRDLVIVDFNPAVLAELKRRGLRGVYGDVASMDTLDHAGLTHARLIVCTLTDAILKGTSNARLLSQLRRIAPAAEVIVASETIAGALALYEAGAAFVFIPRIHSAHRMAEVIEAAVEDGLLRAREEELAELRRRDEVLS